MQPNSKYPSPIPPETIVAILTDVDAQKDLLIHPDLLADLRANKSPGRALSYINMIGPCLTQIMHTPETKDELRSAIAYLVNTYIAFAEMLDMQGVGTENVPFTLQEVCVLYGVPYSEEGETDE